MALMYFLWLSTISCYVRYLSGDFRLKNRLHWELSLRSGPVWFFSSLSIAVVHSTVFFLYCLVCLYKIFTLKLRMLQIYPPVAHVIFHENPVKYRGFCLGFVWGFFGLFGGFFCFFLSFREYIVKLGLAFFPLVFEGQWSLRTDFYHALQMLRQRL